MTAIAHARLLVRRTRLKREVAERERRLLRAIRTALADVRRQLEAPDLRAAAALGSVPAGAADALERAWARHLTALATALAEPVRLERADPEALPGLGQTVADDLARQAIGRLIREISPKQLLAVRAQLAAIMDLGARPEVLQAIAEATGLTRRQTGAVHAYLKRQLAAGVSRTAAARAASRYADRLLTQRAHTIARHEAVGYTNALVLERGTAAAAGGAIITKQSVSARDDRVDAGNPRGICAVLDDGARIPLRQPFVFQGEAFDGPPYHIGCRCLVEIWQES